jgi:hypothetical protein
VKRHVLFLEQGQLLKQVGLLVAKDCAEDSIRDSVKAFKFVTG